MENGFEYKSKSFKFITCFMLHHLKAFYDYVTFKYATYMHSDPLQLYYTMQLYTIGIIYYNHFIQKLNS